MAKRTRRERRLEIEKQKPSAPVFPAESVEIPAEIVAPVAVAPVQAIQTASVNNNRTAINFAQEYFYVYSEVKTLLILTSVMFVVMVGLIAVI